MINRDERMRIKRIYEPPVEEEGCRILIDGLWPIGMSKEAKVDLWLKDIAPSDSLRIRFAHDPTKWEEFKEWYTKELEIKRDLAQEILQLQKKGTVTLPYSATGIEDNTQWH